MTDPVLKGVHHAAILLLSLDQKQATQVLKYMQPDEVQLVAAEMAHVKQVSVEMVDTVMQQFAADIRNHTPLAIDSGNYVQKMLIETLGKESASSVMNGIARKPSSKNIDRLKWMMPDVIADLFQAEHPQMLALLLSLLESDQASAVLSQFPASLRTDLIMRLANMESISEAALTAMDEVIGSHLHANPNNETCRVGGIDTAAEILTRLHHDMGQEVISQLHESDTSLGRQLEDRMLVFEQILIMDDRQVQTLLREISSEMLLMALQGSHEDVQAKFWNNMSKRAEQVLREELELAVTIPAIEIEEARREIMRVARRLQEVEQESIQDEKII